ncbi:MAG: glycosyltransferase family 4 protein [Butyrivibrio sp.]|nr:glycosyltransferase family 4 protein [Butyrivibrio sp.]
MKYIVGTSLNYDSVGVGRKITEQIITFNIKKLNCSLYVLPIYENNNFLTKILKRLPYINLHKHWKIDEIQNEDYLYVRRFGEWDFASISFFLQIKKHNPYIKIVYELPTYPYDNEMHKNLKNIPLLLKDKWNRRYLYKFVDRIATLTDDKVIFGIPTLKIRNGIDIGKIRPRKARNTDVVHAIAVANFSWWHGYDRFIEGMKIYYASNPSRKMIFHLVGHGSEFGRYQKMVAEYGLREYVIFHGQQTGEALDAIYDQCNLGIASLGFHRTGLTEGAPLKTREYLAKGLPFIFGAKVSDISDEDKENIYLQVPATDSPIDIGNILEFYDRIYSEGAEQVNKRLRQFAQDHFSMEAAMKEVIDFFKNGK